MIGIQPKKWRLGFLCKLMDEFPLNAVLLRRLVVGAHTGGKTRANGSARANCLRFSSILTHNNGDFFVRCPQPAPTRFNP